MSELPKTLEDAIAQAQAATVAAIADGRNRLQVELIFPELKLMPIAEQFLPAFETYGDKLKIFFPDAGACALARRDWAGLPYKIEDMGMSRTASIQSKIQPEDEIFLFVSPTPQEIPQLEQICQVIGDRPFIILNPRLDEAGAVGIGYTARQTRMRFLNTIESCYYLRPIMEEAAVFRSYPGIWEVWIENAGDYQRVVELPTKPLGEEVDAILAKGQPATIVNGETIPGKKPNMFRSLQRFIKALSN
jgi:hypothetical protein